MKFKILFASPMDSRFEVETRYRPIWPAYLAAYLEKRIGAESFELRYSSGKGYASELADFQPHVVALGTVSQYYGRCLEFAQMAKARQIPVILGGVHISSLPESLTDDIDAACLGEGEETFAELIECLQDDGRFKYEKLGQIKGIAYLQDHQLVVTEPRPLITPLDRLPHPKRSLIGFRNREYMLTSRGCPFNCVFCSCTKIWKGIRFFTPEYVFAEIEELADRGVKIIRFNDDTFSINAARLERISEMVVRNGIHRRVKFSCWCRADTITPEIVGLLKRMNVVAVVLGLESGSDRVLKYLKGGQASLEANHRAVNLLKDAGIQTSADFIFGIPDETEAEVRQTYDFIKKSRLDFITINILAPFPGSPIWDYAVEKGIISTPIDWRRIDFKFNLDSKSAVVLSDTLTYGQLAAWHKRFHRLSIRKTIKALPHSPWLGELPKIVWKRLWGRFARLGSGIQRAET